MPKLAHIRHERFVQNYVMLGNAAEAYRQAGYMPSSDESAANMASRLLGNVGVQARLQELRDLIAKPALEEAGVTMVRMAQILSEGMDATKTVRGKEVPDWQARLKAIDIINRMLGSYVETNEQTERRGIIINGKVVIVGAENGKVIESSADAAED